VTGAAAPAAAPVHLSALKLSEFRNYPHLSLALRRGPVAIVGDNGAGKTNLLEAISFLSPGRGLRRAPYEAVARTGSPGTWAVAATLETIDGPVALGTGLVAAGDGARGRRVRIDGSDVPAEALLDHLAVLWLVPAMDGLFAGPPGDRRRFLDRLVLAIDAGHAARVSAYERALTERNRLLEIAEPDRRWLDAVEAQIAGLGIAIAAARRELVGCLAGLGEETAGPGDDAAASFPSADLALAGEIESALAEEPATLAEDRFARMLRDGRARDRAAGRTLSGPHRADFVVTHRDKAMPAALASTGEQKALLIGLVLAHARLVISLTGRTPVLLLDEVAAHLDARRRAGLFERIGRLGVQAFMTGTDPSLFALLSAAAQRLTVTDGHVAED
jgi:DNA replication and repair protein RecF